jgi:hypothetical protein
MSKPNYPIFGLILAVPVVLLVGTAPGSTAPSPKATDTMDIRAIAATIDMKSLPQQDLAPEIYE